MRRSILWKGLATLLVCGGIAAWQVREYQPLQLPFPHLTHPPETGVVLGEVADYNDELFAYLIFQYLRTHRSLANQEILIGYDRVNGELVYSIQVPFTTGMDDAIATLHALKLDFSFLTVQWRAATKTKLEELRWQTSNMLSAYNHPSNRKVEMLSRREILAYAAKFIRFKSQTDPRVRRQVEGAPTVLTPEEARDLSRDILTVADFYGLPLQFFLGIGAMENNFMNVTGDLDHAVWKKWAQPGDVVLRRRRGRVLVLNPASGVWQITRETLRWAHRLYLKDERDYSRLPAHLRPSEKLDFEKLDPRVFTTYAGLFLRHLLDTFDGDVAKAVGAYNGGPGNPNPAYEAGVREVANQTRRIMEQAAGLRGVKVAEMQFLSSIPERGH